MTPLPGAPVPSVRLKLRGLTDRAKTLGDIKNDTFFLYRESKRVDKSESESVPREPRERRSQTSLASARAPALSCGGVVDERAALGTAKQVAFHEFDRVRF